MSAHFTTLIWALGCQWIEAAGEYQIYKLPPKARRLRDSEFHGAGLSLKA